VGDRARPGRLGLPKALGSLTAALFGGALPLLAVFYVCIGSTITFNATPQILRKGGVLLGTKALCGVLVAIVAGGGRAECWVSNPLRKGSSRDFPPSRWLRRSTIPMAGSTWPLSENHIRALSGPLIYLEVEL
jgi:hypothetical protein